MSRVLSDLQSGQVKDGVCILCRDKFTFGAVELSGTEGGPNVYTQAGCRETFISDTCERCFDSLFFDDNDDNDGNDNDEQEP